MSIKEIAKAANVSTATVSRVLNGSGKVRKKTTERVMEVVGKMNYQLNHVARRMKVKATDSLIFGLVITDIENPFFANIARGVEEVAYKNKHVMLICNTNESPEKEKFFLNSMLSEKVSGVIIVPSAGNVALFKQLVADRFPLVMIDRYHKDLNIDTVSINNEAGAYQAVQRLIKNGHQRIGIINGIRGLSNTEGRFEGYKKALREAGLPILNQLITYGDYVESGGRKAMHTLLSQDNPPTAVFSANNLMTLGCIKEIYQRNLSIPHEIALIGFDDSTWAEALIPPLTTVKQPGYELGRNAAERLFKKLHSGPDGTMNIVLNPELIIRESCGSKKADFPSPALLR
ncbi:MAG: LacI family DNA-binding transcriptional regulator [Balneolales bacterium]